MIDPTRVSAVARLGEFAVCPPVLASALWMQKGDGSVAGQDVLEAFSTHFDHRYNLAYAAKFMLMPVSAPTTPSKGGLREEALFGEALVEVEAALRRLTMKALGRDPAELSLDFEDHETYRRCGNVLKTLQPEIRAVLEFHASQCPNCKLIGATDSWFGWRRPKGEVIPQSWCSICRSKSIEGALRQRSDKRPKSVAVDISSGR